MVKKMSSRFLYAFVGLLISGIVALLINLLSSAIQQRAFYEQLNTLPIWLLVGLICLGTLIGAWLGGKVGIPSAGSLSASQTSSSSQIETISVTRLRALLSYGKLRGKGIHLKDIILIGSRFDIES